MGLIDDILPGPVALDTAIFIYFIEEDARYLELVRPIFHAIDGTGSGLDMLTFLENSLSNCAINRDRL